MEKKLERMNTFHINLSRNITLREESTDEEIIEFEIKSEHDVEVQKKSEVKSKNACEYWGLLERPRRWLGLDPFYLIG